MRTRLNLSTRPFTNHRLFWLGVATVFLITLLMFLSIYDKKATVTAQIQETSERISKKETIVAEAKRREEEQKLQQQQQKIEITDLQRSELASARLLIGRKSLSMSKLISDLDHFVPEKARITSIKIEDVYTSGQDAVATVEVKAAAQNADVMKEMIVKFEESIEKYGGPFTFDKGHPPSQEAVNEKNEIPFTLRLNYHLSGGSAQ